MSDQRRSPGEATPAAHVRRVIAGAAPDLARTDSEGIWTTTKLLRLAWHEPAELQTMHALAEVGRRAAPR